MILPTLLDAIETAAFADDPVSSHSARFGLARPIGTPAGSDTPSPARTRPWNLRGARTVSGTGVRVATWRYDPGLQRSPPKGDA